MQSLGERLQIFVDTAYPNDFDSFLDVVGVDASTVYRYYQNVREPKASILKAIEEKAGCSASWLLTGNTTMYAENEVGRALRKKRQALGKEHEPELLGHLSDMPGVNLRLVNINDNEIEMLQSLITKIKGQTDANTKGT